jgi:hypothetical protein
MYMSAGESIPPALPDCNHSELDFRRAVLQAKLNDMRAAGCAFLLAAFLATGTARAQSSSAEMVEKGIKLRREHRDAEALDLFRRADQLNPAPRVKAQIGLAEQALAQWVEAERDLTQALSAGQDPWILEHLDALKTALAAIEQHLASVTIESNAAGAELWVNGLRVGVLPLAPLRVVAGTVNVELRSKDFETMRKSIAIEPGKSLTERIVLPAAQPAPAEPRVERPMPAPPPLPPSTTRVLAWGSLTAAGVVLASAVVAEVVREQNAAHYDDDSQCFVPGQGTRDRQCGVYRGRAETAQTFATVGFVAAGALGVASLAFFLAEPSSRDAKASAIRIDAHPGGLAASWTGTF